MKKLLLTEIKSTISTILHKRIRDYFNFEYCRTFMETLQTDFVQFSNTPRKIFFCKRDCALGTISELHLQILIKFPYFLRSLVLSCSVTLEATRTFSCGGNNLVPFYLPWSETTLRIKKVSKYFVTGCLQSFLLLPIFWRMHWTPRMILF